jgi:hypothetical protein
MNRILNKNISIILNAFFSLEISVLGFLFFYSDGLVYNIIEGRVIYSKEIYNQFNCNNYISLSPTLFGLSLILSIINLIINIIFAKQYYFSTYTLLLFISLQVWFLFHAFSECSLWLSLLSINIVLYLFLISIIIALIITIYMRIVSLNKNLVVNKYK